MIVRRIISGGQTGADQAGLSAGKLLDLETGGWMPRGWRTQSGPRPDMRDKYGMVEHTSAAYPPRTEANVKAAGATLVFGNAGSRGCALTVHMCSKHHRPFYLQRWRPGDTISPLEIGAFQAWLREIDGEVLNVAGNREESSPGIQSACIRFLVYALRK
jgi:hypothetical protein